MIKDLPAVYYLGQDVVRLTAMLKALGNPIRFRMMQYLAENVIVDCTGQYCYPESVDLALTDAQGREAKISVFVATGSRRIVMRDAVQENYAAVAKSGSSCGCK